LAAYAEHELQQKKTDSYAPATPHKLYTLDEAMERISVMFGARGLWRTKAWISLQELATEDNAPPADTISGKSFLTALFSASLELAKAGQIDIQQQQNFGPIYVRAQLTEEASHGNAVAE
jgi:segregation and condensation protein A